MLKKFIFGLFAAFSVSAFAFAPSSSGNVTTFAPASIGPTNLDKFTTSLVNGSLKGSGTANVSYAPGKSFPVMVRAPISPLTASKAIGNFAKKAIFPVATAFALIELAQELGFQMDSQNGDLTKIVEGTTQGLTHQFVHNGVVSIRSDPALARASMLSRLNAWETSRGSSTRWLSASLLSETVTNFFYTTTSGGSGSLAISNSPQISTIPTITIVPATIEELEAAVLNKQNWVDASRYVDTLRQAIESGETVQTFQPDLITGPATSPGPVTVTTNTADNTTTTTTVINDHTYNDNTVTTTNTTTTVVTNTTTGEVIDTVTTTTTPEPPPEQTPFEMPCGVAGAPPCAVKVDESGMPPPPVRPMGEGEDALDAEKGKIQTAIDQIDDIDIGSWTWTFQLPTGCTPITLPMMQDFTVDPCQYQPMIHDLMSMIWAITGVFGLFAIFRMGVH